MNHQIIKWLLSGDVSIQYQVYRDVLGEVKPDLRKKMLTKGWAAQFLEKRNANGHWGLGFYQPKWTSTHYTLLDLRNLCMPNDYNPVKESIDLILENHIGPDGGVNPSGTILNSDACINGMLLNYAAYFRIKQNKLETIIDFILDQTMPDGGFNCRKNRSGARHSSLHTTISVLEGMTEYEKNGYTYRLNEIKPIKDHAIEFILAHQLYKSDKSGKTIHPDFLKLCYPCRWRYDILRALDYFQYTKIKWDDRMQAAMDYLLSRQTKDGFWKVQSKHPGKTHFDMEAAGKPSRWNTMRMMRILKHFNIQ